MSSKTSYFEGLQALLFLDSRRTLTTQLENNDAHFLRLQSLIRCSLEHCEVAFDAAKQGQILSALVLTRTAMEHALLARFLHQTPDGSELSEIVIDKHISELSRMAHLAGSTKSAKRLQELIKFAQKDHDRVSTNPNSIIGKFTERDMLKHLYFLLSQSSHPISAFLQYVDLEDDGETKRIRRKSIDQDFMSVAPFLFQILAITLLTDASITKDKELEDSVFSIARDAFSSIDLLITTV
jgi:hypothetical protein